MAGLLLGFAATASGADCTGLRLVLDAKSPESGTLHAYTAGAGGALLFLDKMTLDADGAPRAYHPDDYDPAHPGRCPASGKGLDCPANGGYPDDAYAFAACPAGAGIPCDGHGRALQGPDSQAPGYLVSTTAFQSSPDYLVKNHVDAATIPYVALPSGKIFGQAAHDAGVANILGEFAIVFDRSTGTVVPVLVADSSSAIGPKSRYAHLGEGSIALTKLLRGKDNPRNQEISDKNILVVLLAGDPLARSSGIFAGTAEGKAAAMQLIADAATRRLQRLGGKDWLAACAAAIADSDHLAAGGQ